MWPVITILSVTASPIVVSPSDVSVVKVAAAGVEPPIIELFTLTIGTMPYSI